MDTNIRHQVMSLPLRECGLKYHVVVQAIRPGIVTPLAGVWIEIES